MNQLSDAAQQALAAFKVIEYIRSIDLNENRKIGSALPKHSPSAKN
jgi:hypothetical protein